MSKKNIKIEQIKHIWNKKVKNNCSSTGALKDELSGVTGYNFPLSTERAHTPEIGENK